MMKLIDLLEVIDENATIYVTTKTGDKIVATYDGKNSIDPCYNNCEVIKIRVCATWTAIEIQIKT